MDNNYLGLGLYENRLNILYYNNIGYDEMFKTFIESLNIKHLVLIKSRAKLIEILNDINIIHINDGVLLLVDAVYQIKNISYKTKSYLNYVTLSRDYYKDVRNYSYRFNKKFVVNDEKFILDEIVKNSRKSKLNKIVKNSDDVMILDYITHFDNIDIPFKLEIKKEKLGIKIEVFDELPDKDKCDILTEFIKDDILNKIKISILNYKVNITET